MRFEGPAASVEPRHLKDPYAILGVARGVTEQDLKASFRKKSMTYHPDQNQGSQDAEENFKAVAAAYEILSDPLKRKEFELGEIGLYGTRLAPPRQTPEPAHAAPSREKAPNLMRTEFDKFVEDIKRNGMSPTDASIHYYLPKFVELSALLARTARNESTRLDAAEVLPDIEELWKSYLEKADELISSLTVQGLDAILKKIPMSSSKDVTGSELLVGEFCNMMEANFAQALAKEKSKKIVQDIEESYRKSLERKLFPLEGHMRHLYERIYARATERRKKFLF